jgi:hypothetical protein
MSRPSFGGVFAVASTVAAVLATAIIHGGDARAQTSRPSAPLACPISAALAD